MRRGRFRYLVRGPYPFPLIRSHAWWLGGRASSLQAMHPVNSTVNPLAERGLELRAVGVSTPVADAQPPDYLPASPPSWKKWVCLATANIAFFFAAFSVRRFCQRAVHRSAHVARVSLRESPRAGS